MNDLLWGVCWGAVGFFVLLSLVVIAVQWRRGKKDDR
jgi:hypothetical protein